MQYIRSLDGIRGVAVILVMLFHYGYFAPGWAGVQLFFVLSGFLITRILLDHRGGSFQDNLQRFYWRRTLRIFPVLIVLMVASTILYLAFGFPAEFKQDWAWLAGFAANFARLRDVELGPFHVHMWSLAVEEQFYLLWPLAVLLLPTARLRIVLIAMLLFGPLLRLGVFEAYIAAGFDPEYAGKAVYVLPFTQFDAFAAGGALALWPNLFQKNLGRVVITTLAIAAVCGLAVLAWNHYREDGAFIASLGYAMYLVPGYGFVWAYSLLNLLFLLAIAGTVRSHAWTRPFAMVPLVHIGRISYGVYVYHLPLLETGNWLFPGLLDGATPLTRLAYFAAWSTVVIAVSHASFRLVELPILRLKDRGPGKSGGNPATNPTEAAPSTLN